MRILLLLITDNRRAGHSHTFRFQSMGIMGAPPHTGGAPHRMQACPPLWAAELMSHTRAPREGQSLGKNRQVMWPRCALMSVCPGEAKGESSAWVGSMQGEDPSELFQAGEPNRTL